MNITLLQVTLAENASVLVRLCDGRRDAELPAWTTTGHPVSTLN